MRWTSIDHLSEIITRISIDFSNYNRVIIMMKEILMFILIDYITSLFILFEMNQIKLKIEITYVINSIYFQ
jgi:hypothetical protein